VRIGWPVWAVVLGVAAVAGVTFAILRQSQAPAAIQAPVARRFAAAATWAAGTRKAPDFTLTDQHGAPISLASLRGRPVIVTFIDPLCRNLCPLEAKVLMQMTRRVPAAKRPTIVSVSVNPWGNTKANFALDAEHWQLGPDWRWAAGSQSKLAPVWRAYQIEVQVLKKAVAGVTVRQIAHTEGSYVIDRDGFERALFLYPFRAVDVAKTVNAL
jgi:cytochrome oxidase Cu insertion factor (SCO1/SenC/PrrC family)